MSSNHAVQNQRQGQMRPPKKTGDRYKFNYEFNLWQNCSRRFTVTAYYFRFPALAQ
jgi:hypothetical protein